MAVLVATPEAIGAVRAAITNQLQRSINIFLGSVLSTISMTMPLNKEKPMTVTVLYPEDRQIADLVLEQEIFGPDAPLRSSATNSR